MTNGLESLKKATPWFVKIPFKIILSRLPVGGRRWQRLNLFRAGTMDSPAEAFAIFKKHLNAAGLDTLKGCTALELGPGNSALSALFAAALGARRTWLVDAQVLVSQDVALFNRTQDMLLGHGLAGPSLNGASSVSEVLTRLNGIYLTDGLKSLKTIPDNAVDFLFSNAVLEHIRLAEFAETLTEMRRVLTPDGIASHQIDFRDHLQNGLNNLRFSQRVWESDFMASSGFYTNRIIWPSMEQLFRNAGFSVDLRSSELWPRGLPTPQKSMATPFKNVPEDQLAVMDAHVVLRHQRSGEGVILELPLLQKRSSS